MLLAKFSALPGGTLLFPRAVSNAAAAPYLGESAILYFLTVPPAPGVPIVRGGSLSGLVYLGLLVSAAGTLFGVRRVIAILRGRPRHTA